MFVVESHLASTKVGCFVHEKGQGVKMIKSKQFALSIALLIWELTRSEFRAP